MGLAIPSQIVALLTFPGVVAREVVEQFFCRWLGVAVLDVCYFRFGSPPGYVAHEPKLPVRQSLWIGLGPFFVNSLLGALVAFPAVLPALELRVSNAQSYVLAWLGISIAAHALPNREEAVILWHTICGRECPLVTRLLATPVAGLVLIVSAGRIFGLDLLYGVAMVAAPPVLLLYILH
jgi:hypothetical protein